MRPVTVSALAFLVALLLGAPAGVRCKKHEGEDKPAWAKKDIRDFSDADLERLYDQWEEDEEPLPPDELPPHLQPPPSIDMSKLDMSNPESVLEATKKGKTLMVFVTVAGKPPRARADELTKLWQTGLWNNHIQAERFMIDDDRAIFMFKDGSQAFTAKDFLMEQEELQEFTIEGKSYLGNKPHVRNKAVRIGDEL